MGKSAFLMFFLLALCGCIIRPGGETYLPVEQAALQANNKTMREAIEYIEPLLAAHGYKSPGIYLEMENAREINRRYEGPSNSSASLRAKDGCISFITWVEEGTREYIAPRTAFNHVLFRLRQDGSWKIEQGVVC